MLELLALGTDPEAARTVARELGGVALLAEPDPPDRDPPPFRSLVRAVTADPAVLTPVADVGLYLSFRRKVRSHPGLWTNSGPTPGVVAAFGLALRPELTRAEGDAHWRDVHAPLALRHHVGMWDYTQCSVVHRFAGPDFDGFALCGFATDHDLRHRFYDDDAGRAAIGADVASFSDPARSTRAVRCREWSFGP